jgi:uncharacterized SAM-binding protein YcdF (DUF218 family)
MVGFKAGKQFLKNLSRKQRITIYGFILGGSILLPPGLIPIRLFVAVQQSPVPEAILTLGGDPKREEKAAQLAQYYPKLDVWISTGEKPEISAQIFQARGISKPRLHLDFRASDTVTNFTTLVHELQKANIRHVYLITSDFHMPRSKAIATIVLGSQGITFTPVSVASKRLREESPFKTVRDILRSLFWMYTGLTGPHVNFDNDNLD